MCEAVKAGTRIFLYAFKCKFSLIILRMVLGQQPASFAIFLADFLFLLITRFRLTLALKSFFHTILSRPLVVLSDIPDLSMWSTYLYTVALEV